MGIVATVVAITGGVAGTYMGIRGFRLGTLRRVRVAAAVVSLPGRRGPQLYLRFSAQNPGNQPVPLGGLVLRVGDRELDVGEAVPGCFPHDLPGGKSLHVPILAEDVRRWMGEQGLQVTTVKAYFVDGRGNRYRTRPVGVPGSSAA